MAWFDDPTAYFGELDPDEGLNQGDILVVPTTLTIAGLGESDIQGPAEIGGVRTTTVWHGSDDAFPAAPDISVRTEWGLAMVVPHICAMEKEWNDRRDELIGLGSEPEAAGARALGENLDEYITVAPLRYYDEIDERRHAGIRNGNRLGFFPVPTHVEAIIPEGFIDFNRLTTVHYTLTNRVRRLAVLSDLVVAHLHHGLAMHFSYRSLAGLVALERAIGQTIDKVTTAHRSGNKVLVTFTLSDGATLTLESKDANPELAEAVRPAR